MIHLPARHNPKLRHLLELVDADAELAQLWKCANVNTVDRSGISDHGEVHVRIVANATLKLLRLLAESDIEPSVVTDYGLTMEDAEVIVVLASCLHDVGIAIHRDNHENLSLAVAYPKCRQLLAPIYHEPTLTIMTADTLHAVLAHHGEARCLTIEAGVVKVADALDMTEGRSRIPFEAGRVNIHSLSAQAIESVSIEKGEDRPVRIVVNMANSAGIFQVDELLKRKLQHSSLAPYVEIVATISGETERRLIDRLER